METCTEEVGLLRKHPCGKPKVSQCANCEQALCKDHAVAQMLGTKKTGKFMCKACHAAWLEYEKTKADPAAKPAAPPAKPATPPPAAAPKPAPAAAAAAAKPAAPAPAKPAEAPKSGEAPKPGEKKPLSLEDTGPLEFSPSKPPEEKK